MTSHTSTVPLSCVSVALGLTAEHMKAYRDSDVKRRKSILRLEYEAKQRRFAEKVKQTEQRVVDLAKRRRLEKSQRIAKNIRHAERMEEKIDEIKTADFYRKLNLIVRLKNRDQEKKKLIAKMKENKLAEKREKLLQWYWAIVERQNHKLERDAAILGECVMNLNLYDDDGPMEEVDDVDTQPEIQEESAEHCDYIQRGTVMIPGVNHEWVNEDESFRVKIMERIGNLKLNFDKCEHGEAFWEKTTPLWNLLTQCLRETLPDVIVEPEIVHELVPVDSMPLPSLMKQIMMDDVDYNMTDKEMVEVLILAKKLAGSHATAADIIELTRRMVEYNADVKAVTDYMVHGLIERSVFEYVKREVSKVIFVDMRKTIDRLQHVNDKGIIPNEVVKNNDVDRVTMAVCDLIHNDDSFRHFDQPLDDERDYEEAMAYSAVEKMRTCMQSTHDLRPVSRTNAMTVFPMPRKDGLPERIGKTIKQFLGLAHSQTAIFLSKNQPKKSTKSMKNTFKPSKITMMNIYRISRKLTKFTFDMFINDDVKQSDFLAVVDSYRMLVAKRTPRVEYDRRVFLRAEDIDLQFFLKQFEKKRPKF